MPRRMAIATMGLLPCLSLAGQSDAGDIARRIIRADGLPCAFLGPAPLPLTRGAGAPRARRDKSRLPRSMREAVSSGSATGHGDGPEPLWPRLASGDLRPAPAGIHPAAEPATRHRIPARRVMRSTPVALRVHEVDSPRRPPSETVRNSPRQHDGRGVRCELRQLEVLLQRSALRVLPQGPFSSMTRLYSG